MDRKKSIVMKIAEKRDGEAIQTLRPTVQDDVSPQHARSIGLDQNGVAAEYGQPAQDATTEKFPPADGLWQRICVPCDYGLVLELTPDSA